MKVRKEELQGRVAECFLNIELRRSVFNKMEEIDSRPKKGYR